MAAKQMRSLRLSEEVIKLVEAQPGDSFTAQFEYLVNRAYLELPKSLLELEKVDQLIAQKKEYVSELWSRLTSMRSASRSLDGSLDAAASVMCNLQSALDDVVNATSEVLHDV